MKQINLQNKAIGFYVGLASALLCAVTAIVYAVAFSGIQYKEQVFDSTVCVLLIAAGVIAAVMLFFDRLAGFAPVLLCAASGVSLLLYIHAVIWPISDTIVGIEPFPEFTELVVCMVLLVVSFVISEASLYMKKSR